MASAIAPFLSDFCEYNGLTDNINLFGETYFWLTDIPYGGEFQSFLAGSGDSPLTAISFINWTGVGGIGEFDWYNRCVLVLEHL